jgi:hypothetical protein
MHQPGGDADCITSTSARQEGLPGRLLEQDNTSLFDLLDDVRFLPGDEQLREHDSDKTTCWNDPCSGCNTTWALKEYYVLGADDIVAVPLWAGHSNFMPRSGRGGGEVARRR